MAQVKYRLRKPNEQTPQPIYLVFRYRTKKIVYGVGLKIQPQYWNSETQRVRNVIQAVDKDKINNLLNELQTVVERTYTALLTAKQVITNEKIKIELDKYLNRYTENEQNKNKTLFGFIEEYIQRSQERINTNTGQNISNKTVQKYKTTLNTLKHFGEKFNKVLDFDTVDLDFYLDYSEYLKKDLNLSTNTIGKHIQTLKVFLNAATDRGLNTKLDFKSLRFKVVSEESESIYLTELELKKIYDFDFSYSKKLEKTRDLFIIGCWTGLRFSDFTNIKSQNIKGDFIEIIQQKTGHKIIIPIHHTVKEILNKYKGVAPESISNQKLNEYLKEVMQAVDLTESVYKSITKGGVKITKEYAKYELVSSHTARRSFATNLYKSGFPAISIMQITGHKTEKAFLKYIKVTPKEHAKMLQVHWAKNDKILKVI